MAGHPVVEELLAAAPTVSDADSLIGLFQAFRPDGLPLLSSLESVPGGGEFARRIQSVFDAVSASQRGDRMKDAYFVVRRPPLGASEFLEQQARRFVASSVELAKSASVPGQEAASDPELRMLEGKPPKHPKADREKADLLFLFQDRLPSLLSTMFRESETPAAKLAVELEESLYFVACDTWLRDYLRMPLLGESPYREVADQAASAYFDLWRHGIKFRIFSEQRIDFYLPRRDDGSLIDAGQFARR
ncbi:MAG: hypothetical protein Aurels2KO_15860 [Aureliella sp.]